jgi:hypothetical protein
VHSISCASAALISPAVNYFDHAHQSDEGRSERQLLAPMAVLQRLTVGDLNNPNRGWHQHTIGRGIP